MNDARRLRQGRAGDAANPVDRWTAEAPSVDDLTMFCLVVDVAGTLRWANESARRVLRLDTHPTLVLTAFTHWHDRSHVGSLIRQVHVTGIPREVLVELASAEPGVSRQVHLVLSAGREPTDEIPQGQSVIVVQGWDVTDVLHRARRFPAHQRRDRLTGLTSRSALTDRLHREVAWSVLAGHGLALIVVEVDGLSAVNDKYGPQIRDQALATLCGRLAGSLRPGDTLARVGPDEFAVICSDLRDPGDAMGVVDRLRHRASEPISTRDGEFALTLTVGAAFSDGHDCHDRHDRHDGVALLLRRADQAIDDARIPNQGKPRS